MLNDDSPGYIRPASYLYGLSRIGELQPGGFLYHLTDALGSVRQLVDETATVKLAQSYEPYGAVLSSIGSRSSAYAFTGEQYDAVTGLVFLRARYLSVLQGRFISRDTWPGDSREPRSLNKWGYAQANPISLTDPSGRSPVDPWWCETQPNPELCRLRAWNDLDTTDENRIKASTIRILLEYIFYGSCDVGSTIGIKPMMNQETGLGTLVDYQGRRMIYTHNHYTTLYSSQEVIFQNSQGDEILRTSADKLRRLPRRLDSPGNLLIDVTDLRKIVVVNGLPPADRLLASEWWETLEFADFGEPRAVSEGTYVKVAHREGTGIGALDAEVRRAISTENEVAGQPHSDSIFWLKSLTVPIVHGDSGGGIWLKGKVVGNNWWTSLYYEKGKRVYSHEFAAAQAQLR